MNTRRTFIATFLALFLLPAFAFGATKEELQKRFKDRYGELRALKDAGTIGETDGGLVEVVSGNDAKVKKLVDAENADRKELYGLIAKDNSGETAERVAKQAAQRNFEKAKKGDMLKIDGKWRKKE